MSTSSGLTVASDVTAAYASAVSEGHTRFILVSVQGETLVLNRTVSVQNEKIHDDLSLLLEHLDEKIPSYILARLDDEEISWLFISYVPEAASVRDKMLYASSRSVLSKSLGDQKIKDNLFATSKDDLTPEAYTAHVRHTSAPQPMSSREAEMEQIRAAERAGGGFVSSQARSPMVIGGAGVGLKWTDDVTNAVSSLGEEDIESRGLVIISINSSSETLELSKQVNASLEDIPNLLPTDTPSYAFFAWDHIIPAPPERKRSTIFIYTCPSSSLIKQRMIYSSSVSHAIQTAKTTCNITVTKKFEASDPSDLDMVFIRQEIEGRGAEVVAPAEEKKPFARPRGPARKR